MTALWENRKLDIISILRLSADGLFKRYANSDSSWAMIVDNDYSRELYTKTFTGSDWTDARNYDMTLNVRRFGVNGAVDFILQSIE